MRSEERKAQHFLSNRFSSAVQLVLDTRLTYYRLDLANIALMILANVLAGIYSIQIYF